MEKTSKFKQFTQEHEAIWQFIKFSIMSSIAAVTEIVSYLLLNSVLLVSMNAEPFKWWIFNYAGGTSGGLGTMIAFLVSTTLAQIVAFITNRKTTFKADNNILMSVLMYTIMVIIIICIQTYLGPILVSKLDSFLHNPTVSGLFGKLILMFMTFLIVFPMSKYVIMRKKAEKKEVIE